MADDCFNFAVSIFSIRLIGFLIRASFTTLSRASRANGCDSCGLAGYLAHTRVFYGRRPVSFSKFSSSFLCSLSISLSVSDCRREREPIPNRRRWGRRSGGGDPHRRCPLPRHGGYSRLSEASAGGAGTLLLHFCRCFPQSRMHPAGW